MRGSNDYLQVLGTTTAKYINHWREGIRLQQWRKGVETDANQWEDSGEVGVLW